MDDNLKELSPHGSFELPVETYTGNCEIFHALYDHWHSEMEIMYIEKGSGFARLNRESIRLKKGDILIVNCGVLHSMRTDLNNPLYYKKCGVLDLDFWPAAGRYLPGMCGIPSDGKQGRILPSYRRRRFRV